MNRKTTSYYANVRPEMTDFIRNTPTRVLEVGCGEGMFRKNFRNETEYWGIEPCVHAVNNARNILTKALTGTYDDTKSKIPSGYFDLIVCNDVIEHMSDPRAFLKDIQTKLTDDGYMIVSIPNLRNAITLYELLFKGNFQYTDSGVLDYTHFHLFTLKSFKLMAEECGWNVELCKPLPPQPFKPIKNLILSCMETVIPGIRSLQIAARLRPASKK